MKWLVYAFVLHVVGSLRTGGVGRLRYHKHVPMESVVWSENNFPQSSAAYVLEVDGVPKAALLVNGGGSEPAVATRMIYDVSDDALQTIEYLPTFRFLVHNYVKQIDLTHLPHDERVQFLVM